MKLKSLLIATLIFCGVTLFGQGNDTTLKVGNNIPLTDPYDGLVTVTSIPNGVCDWVKVVLRSGTAGNTAVDSAYGFVLYDGSIVASDGVSDLAFENAAPGSYYAVVYHRNHLAIMSKTAIDISSGSASWDFTTAATQAYGDDLKDLTGSGPFGMYVGDYDKNGAINATDFSLIRTEYGLTGYYQGDMYMNAAVNATDRATARTQSGKATNVPL